MVLPGWCRGAGRGIGLAIAAHMSGKGWDVYGTASSDAALPRLDAMPKVHGQWIYVQARWCHRQALSWRNSVRFVGGRPSSDDTSPVRG